MLGVIEQVTLSYTMQDQLGATSAGIAVVTITGTNDSPVSTVAVMQTIAEDTAIVFNSANGNAISVSDVDVIAANHTITLAVTNGTLTLSGTAGLSFSVGNGATDTMMTFSGTIEAINIALNGMSYAPTPNYHGGAVIAVTIDDNIGGASLNDTKTVAINVTPVDDDLVVARTTATGFVPSSALTATADILIGAGGNDTFVFHSTSVGDETIVDFTSGADLLQISVAGAGFAGYGLAADAAVVVMNTDSIYGVTSASSGTFIFDTTAQSLYWDADGGLGANAVLLARLQNVSSLFALDFHLA